jgi:hypothetical protein
MNMVGSSEDTCIPFAEIRPSAGSHLVVATFTIAPGLALSQAVHSVLRAFGFSIFKPGFDSGQRYQIPPAIACFLNALLACITTARTGDDEGAAVTATKWAQLTAPRDPRRASERQHHQATIVSETLTGAGKVSPHFGPRVTSPPTCHVNQTWGQQAINTSLLWQT